MKERVIAVFSDIEMGRGGLHDDFPHSAWLGELLVDRCEGPWRDLEVDVVLDGDTFDLLKTPYRSAWPHHVTAEVALEKMRAVASAHAPLFAAMRQILAHPVPRRFHFVVGNHDAELVFPEVQGLIHALCGYAPGVFFPGFALQLGPVHLEHGHQQDLLFRVDPDRPFLSWKDQEVLNMAWASVALLDAVIPYQPDFGFYDRVRPKSRVLELAPEMKELLLALGWKYWTGDFWRDWYRAKDPLLKLRWSMVRDVIGRFLTTDTELAWDERWLVEEVERSPCELFVTGHLHHTRFAHHGRRRIVQLGCFRDEYLVSDDGRTFEPVLKPWLELRVRDDRVVGLSLREVQGPDRPADHFPDSIHDGAQRAREILDALGEAARRRAREEA